MSATPLPERLTKYMASDLAVTDKKKSRFADYTVHLCGGLAPDGRMYMLDGWLKRCDPSEWIDALLDMVRRWKPMKWSSEGGVIRRSVEGQIETACIENSTYFDMNWIPPIGDKSARGVSLKAWAKMGRVVFPNTEWAEKIIEHMVGFPAARYDDGYDAMATLFLSLDGVVIPRASSANRKKKRDAYERVKPTPKDKWLTK